mmetsp:Transcript_29812/g.75437  ORF Transcript_29812/g.75437 Transcript_29812/m.75437 type:complete len:476 (-) Transcript_29812:129-1556(-)
MESLRNHTAMFWQKPPNATCTSAPTNPPAPHFPIPANVAAAAAGDLPALVFYATVVALALQCGRLLGDEKSKAYEGFLRKRFNLRNLHAACTPAAFWLFEAAAGHARHWPWAFYGTGCLLAWLLWDGGSVYRFPKGEGSSACRFHVSVAMHHLGAFVAYAFQAESDPQQARHNTFMFGWLWLCHGFGSLEKLYNYVTRGVARRRPGARSPLFRECYAFGTVWLAHRYISAPGQPGLGANYQTVALAMLLCGRYSCMDNAWKAPFIRRVEFPGTAFVHALALTGGAVLPAAAAAAWAWCAFVLVPFSRDVLCNPEQELRLRRRGGPLDGALRFPSLRAAAGGAAPLLCADSGGGKACVAFKNERARGAEGCFQWNNLMVRRGEGAAAVVATPGGGELAVSCNEVGMRLCYRDALPGDAVFAARAPEAEEKDVQWKLSLQDDGTLSPEGALHLVVGVRPAWDALTPAQRVLAVLDEL